MTDRELLELAAKAVGIEVNANRTDARFASGNDHDGLWTGTSTSWTPLHDSGDALALAVNLKIDIKQYDDYVVCWYENYFGTGIIKYDGDPLAATRRAIVLAAAELGKAMP